MTPLCRNTQDLTLNMKCVLWFLFYCILLGVFWWLIQRDSKRWTHPAKLASSSNEWRIRRLHFKQDGFPTHWHRDVRRFLNESLPHMDRSLRERRPGASVLALEISWSHTLRLFLVGFVKEAVYVQSLPTTFDDLKNRITTAVNSVTQDILLRVWNEFSYRLDVTRAAGGGHIEHL